MDFKITQSHTTSAIAGIITIVMVRPNVEEQVLFFGQQPQNWYFLGPLVALTTFYFLTKRKPFLPSDEVPMEDAFYLTNYILDHPLVQLTFPKGLSYGEYTYAEFLSLPDGSFMQTFKIKNQEAYVTFVLDGRLDLHIPRKLSMVRNTRLKELGVENLTQLCRHLRAQNKTTMFDVIDEFPEDARKDILVEMVKGGSPKV